MKTPSRTLLFPVIAAALFFIGCEGSPVPLSESTSAVLDPTLPGWWTLVTPAEDAPDGFRVWPFNDHEYYVEYYDVERKDGVLVTSDTLRLRVFLTPLDGARFANVQCVDCDDRTYLFMGIERPSPDALLLRPLEDDLFESVFARMTTPAEAAAYVRSRLQEASLYEEGETALFKRGRP